MTNNLPVEASVASVVPGSTANTGLPIASLVVRDTRNLVPTAAGYTVPETEYADIVESDLLDDDFDPLLPELESILQDIVDQMV